jgi:hypothetical protein
VANGVGVGVAAALEGDGVVLAIDGLALGGVAMAQPATRSAHATTTRR